jgi:type IV pilus assembly protein PilO
MLERIFDLPRTQRILYFGGLLVLLLFLYFYFLYWPRSQQLAEKRQTLSNSLQERDRLSPLAANLEKARKEAYELDARLKEAAAQLPDEKEIPDLLGSISSLGRESGLEVLLFRLKPETFQDFYAEVPVEMAVRGGYHQVAVFFDKVRKMDRIINITNITLKEPKLTGGQTVIDAAFSATTFRFLSDEERARIAAAKKAAEKKE